MDQNRLFKDEDNIVRKMNSSPPSRKRFRFWEQIPLVIENKREEYSLAKEEQTKTDLHDHRTCKHLHGESIGTGECTICISLISAVKNFDVAEVTRLLSTQNADAMCIDAKGEHVLYVLLCQAACKPTTDEGDFEKVDHMKSEVAKLLLHFGADIACTDPYKYPPLSFDLCGCIERGETLFVSLMLSSGYQYLYLPNAAILVACSHRNLLVLRKLLESGANANESRRCFISRSALHICVEQNWLEGVETLIESHAFLDQMDGAGKTALDYASRLELALGNFIIIKKLLQAGASVTRDLLFPLLRTDVGSLFFLDYVLACTNGRKGINIWLVHIEDELHNPLGVSWIDDSLEKFKLLLKHGAHFEFVLDTPYSDMPRIDHASHLHNLKTFQQEVREDKFETLKDFVDGAVLFQFPIAQLFSTGPASYGPLRDRKGLLRSFFIRAGEMIDESARTYAYLNVVPPSGEKDIFLTSISGFKKLSLTVKEIRTFLNGNKDVLSVVTSFLIEKNKEKRMVIREFATLSPCMQCTKSQFNDF